MKASSLACLLLLASFASGLQATSNAMEASVAVSTDEPGNVFTDLKNPLFRMAPSEAKAKREYEIVNWKGESLENGSWEASESSPLTLRPLPPGYYAMKLSGYEGSVPFSVVVDPSKRTYNPESFFAMDTAQSWLCSQKPNNPRQPKDGFKTASDLCKLAGLSMVRERMSWGEVAKDPYEFSWGRYMVNAKLLSERGIKVSGMFHDSPKWARNSAEDKLPENLFALHDFAKKAASTYKGMMTDWEFWNEEDGGFIGSQTVWDFAACQKAAYLGFKEGNPEVPVLNGAFCVYPLPNFDDLFFMNGGGDYFDIFNYHIYKNLPSYPKINADLRELLGRYGLREVPIWITENGSNYEGVGKIDSFMKGLKEHDAEQELLMMEFVPKAQIRMQAEGIARDFFFVLPAYNERGGGKPWGMLRWDYTAKPNFVAFANLTYQLANAKYLGTFDLGPEVQGYLYEQPDGTQTLAFWSESDLDKIDKDGAAINMKGSLERPVSIKIQSCPIMSLFRSCSFTLTDVAGLEERVSPEGGALKLTATRYPSYLSGLKGLSPSKPAPSTGSVRRADSSKELSVVLKADLLDKFSIDSKTFANLNGESGKIALDVYNFSDVEKTGSISSVVGKGRIDGFPAQVIVPARGKVRLEGSFVPQPVKGSAFSEISISGVFGGKAVSPVYIPVFSPYAMEKASLTKAFELEKADRWRKNSSGDMQISFDEAQKAVKVSVKFKPGTDFWAYPEYVLKTPGESLKGALGMSFEIKAEQKGGKREYAHHLVMAVTENTHETGESRHFEYKSPTPEWQRVFIMFEGSGAGFDPANVKLLRLGVNPKEDEVSYWFRNVKVYFKE